MCIPHGAGAGKSNGFQKEEKAKKHIEPLSKNAFEKGDPNFIDERTHNFLPKKKESFFSSIFE